MKQGVNYWQLIETTFLAIAGRNAHRAAAAALRVPQADLRATFDCDDLTDEAINAMLARMRHAAVRYSKIVAARAARAHAASMAVQIAQNDRMRDLMQREEDIAVADPNNPVNIMTAAFIADLLEATD